MAGYIDAEYLMLKISRMIDYCEKGNKVNGLTALFQVGDAIMDCPTADVAEVKHGRWMEVDDGVLIGDGKHIECSECGTWAKDKQKSNYCSHCGAKMDGWTEVSNEEFI